MPYIENRENGTIRLKIEDALSIYDASGLREILLKSLGAQGDVALDFSEATGCDVAGLQLLCSLRKSAERLEKQVRVEGVSSTVLDTLAAAGLKPGEVV